MYQLVEEPTHFTTNLESWLDHFIFRQTNKCVVCNIIIVSPLDRDHCSVLVDVGRPAGRKCILKTKWLYNDGNYTSLADDFTSFDWAYIDDPIIDIDDVAQRFCDQFDVLLKRHIPTRVVTTQ